MASLAGAVRGSVQLAAFPTAAASLVPPALRACRRDHPQLRVVLHEQEPERSLPALRLGALDLAVVHEYDLLPRRDDPAVELTPLLVDPIQVALPPGHPALGDAVPLGKLRGERWIAAHADSSCHASVQRACALAGYTPEVDFHTNDFSVALALVEAGLGVTLLPALAAGRLTARVELRPVAELPLTRQVSVAARAGTVARPAVAAVIRALTEAAPPAAPSSGPARAGTATASRPLAFDRDDPVR